MLISEETIQSLQSMVRVEEVIADFLPLKKKGQNFWACCPFHQEHTPSFAVSPIKGFYKCFGCDAAGDAITFVQEIENCSFVEAITYLAQKYGIAIVPAELDKATNRQVVDTNAKLYALLNLATAYFSNLLWNHPEAAQVALPYLNQREISPVIAKKFSLGYSLNSWDGFYPFAIGQGISVEELVAAGLVIQNGAKIYDRFRGRLMFPIHNSRGQVVAFAARHMTTVAGDSPKYINSPETSIYHKGELLYGFSFAKQRIKQENNCYLVEGYTDVLAFHHMVGWEQVVASAGTSLTEAQMGYLFRFTTKITLVFDGDQAGIRAALRGIDKLLAKGFEVKIILLPPGEDPDSYLRKIGAAAFIHYLNHAIQDFITFKAGFLLNHTSEQHPVEQAQCIRDIVRSIVAIPDEITRSLFLKKCSKLFSIEEALLLSTYHELCNQATSTPLLQQKRSFIKRHGTGNHSPYVDHRKLHFINKLTTSIEAYEQEIMRIVLTYGCVKLSEEQYLYEYMFLELGDIAFRSANCIMLFDYFKKVLQLGGTVDIQCCLDGMDEAIKKIAIDLMASPHEISEAWVKKYGIYTVGEIDNVYQMSLEVILRLKIRLVQELIEQNREELTKELTLEAEEHLLQVHQSLKASECSIAKRLGTVVAQ